VGLVDLSVTQGNKQTISRMFQGMKNNKLSNRYWNYSAIWLLQLNVYLYNTTSQCIFPRESRNLRMGNINSQYKQQSINRTLIDETSDIMMLTFNGKEKVLNLIKKLKAIVDYMEHLHH
jgi:hypothetical protein